MGHFIAVLYRSMSSGGRPQRGVITQQAGMLSGPSGDQTPTHLHGMQDLSELSSQGREAENAKRLSERERGENQTQQKSLTFGQNVGC